MQYNPKMMEKQKFHLILHLPKNMAQYGPSFSFNTERQEEYVNKCLIYIPFIIMHRCEHFNSIMRDINLHSNRKASSRDIATRFAKVEAIRLLKEGDGRGRYR